MVTSRFLILILIFSLPSFFFFHNKTQKGCLKKPIYWIKPGLFPIAVILYNKGFFRRLFPQKKILLNFPSLKVQCWGVVCSWKALFSTGPFALFATFWPPFLCKTNSPAGPSLPCSGRALGAGAWSPRTIKYYFSAMGLGLCLGFERVFVVVVVFSPPIVVLEMTKILQGTRILTLNLFLDKRGTSRD